MTREVLNQIENKSKINFKIDNKWIEFSYPKCETTTT